MTYFGPGVHKLPLVDPEVWGGDAGSRGLALTSHSTLYLAEGAVVLGGIRVHDVENVTIRGFGIIAATFLPGEAIGADRECVLPVVPTSRSQLSVCDRCNAITSRHLVWILH
eukprot:SAG22_NODE_2727_length_2276_cov_1.092329_3_plen_112_part_00